MKCVTKINCPIVDTWSLVLFFCLFIFYGLACPIAQGWVCLNSEQENLLLSRNDIIICENTDPEFILYAAKSGYSTQDEKRKRVADPSANGGSAARAPEHWLLQWALTRHSAFRNFEAFELYVVVRVEKIPDCNDGVAFSGGVWGPGRLLVNSPSICVNVSEVPDEKWHVWRIGESPGKLKQYVWLDRGKGVKNVYVDRFILAPVQISPIAKKFLAKYFNEQRKPAICIEAINKKAVAIADLNTTSEVKMRVLLRPVNGTSKASVNAVFKKKNETRNISYEILPGINDIKIFPPKNFTLTQLQWNISGGLAANRLYCIIDSPKPEMLVIRRITAIGQSDFHENQGCKEAVKLGNFIIRRSMLPEASLKRAWALRTESSIPKLHARVIRNRWIQNQSLEQVNISVAKNEYESFQIIIVPLQKRNITLSLSYKPLKLNQDVQTKSVPKILFEKTEYVYCRKTVYDSGYVGYWPDPLIPFEQGEKLELGWDRVWAIRVTVKANSGIASGDYVTNIEVSDLDGFTEIVPVKVHVYNFELPLRSAARSAFFLYRNPDKRASQALANAYGLTKCPWNITKRYLKKASSYRINIVDEVNSANNQMVIAIREPDGSLSFDFTEKDRFVSYVLEQCNGNAFNIARASQGLETWLRMPVRNRVTGEKSWLITRFLSSEYLTLMQDYLKAAVAHYKNKGWFKYAYLSLTDEPPRILPHVKGMTRKQAYIKLVQTVRDAVPGLKILCVGSVEWTYLEDVTDISVCLSKHYNEEQALAFRKLGKETWWYVCASPNGAIGSPWTNYWIDEPGIDHRLHFWRAWRKNVQGFLYWGINWWGVKSNAVGWEKTGWKANPYPGRNGDGYLMYPGPNGQPYGSVRLSIMRDGLEDYDYFVLIEQMVKKAENSMNRRVLAWANIAKCFLETLKKQPEYSREKKLMRLTNGNTMLLLRKKAARIIERGKKLGL